MQVMQKVDGRKFLNIVALQNVFERNKMFYYQQQIQRHRSMNQQKKAVLQIFLWRRSRLCPRAALLYLIVCTNSNAHYKYY